MRIACGCLIIKQALVYSQKTVWKALAIYSQSELEKVFQCGFPSIFLYSIEWSWGKCILADLCRDLCGFQPFFFFFCFFFAVRATIIFPARIPNRLFYDFTRSALIIFTFFFFFRGSESDRNKVTQKKKKKEIKLPSLEGKFDFDEWLEAGRNNVKNVWCSKHSLKIDFFFFSFAISLRFELKNDWNFP